MPNGHLRPAVPRTPPDLPYTLALPDGRRVFVEIPGRWTARDRSGEVALRPDAVRLLDDLRMLATRVPIRPSAGQIRILRRALGLTQQQIADRVGVDRLTVSRWECGTLHPSPASRRGLERLRRAATRKGVILAAG